MKHLLSIALGAGLLLLLLCTLPDNPADEYSNANVSLKIDSLTADSSGTFTDTIGNAISFRFIRFLSQHIDSFVVDFDDGTPVCFVTATNPSDTISSKHTFQSVGINVVSLTIYYKNNMVRELDSLAIIRILNRKPEFTGIKPDSVFNMSDSSFIAIPVHVLGSKYDALVLKVVNQNLPESSSVSLVGDSSLHVYVPANTSGSFQVVLQVADQLDSSSMTIKLHVSDRTPPFAPIFTSSQVFTTTTPVWVWKTGGNGGCGTYRFNLDNDNITASIFAEKATTSFQPPMSLSEGVHTLFIQERDSSGNWSQPSSWAITIDATAPSAPVVSGVTPTNNRKPTWSWVGSNATEPHFRYQLDSATFSSTDTSSTLATSFTPATELSEGKHTLYVREIDIAGNLSVSGSFTINIDLTGPQAPTVSGTTPTTNNRPVWTWISNGGGGVGDFRCALDTSSFDNAFATSAKMFTAPQELTEGEHTLNVQERDSAGNWSSVGSFTVLIDITAPNPPIVSVVSITNSQAPTWTWTAGGGGNGTFRYKLDNDDLSVNATENKALSFTPPTNLTEGLHTFYIQERDSTGNWSTMVSKETTIDLTPPDKPVISGLSLTNNPKPSWAWTSEGDGSFRLKIDSKDMNTGAISLDTTVYTSPTSLAEGNHVLFVQVRDSAGNWSSLDSFITTIDLTAPSAPNVIGSATSNSPKPTWSWSSGGNGAGQYRYKLDIQQLDSGAEITTLTSFTPANNLPEGEHTLYVQESDAAGNWSLSGSFKIAIDTTASGAPSVSGISPTNNQKPTWSWKSGGGSESYRYKLDDSTFTTGTTETTDSFFTPGTNLAEGAHVLYVEEDDGSGNWSSKGLFIIHIDITPPSPPVLTGISPTNLAKPTWTWKLGNGGNGTYRYKFNNSDLTTGTTVTTDTSYTPQTDLAEMSHVLYLQEQDAAGNWSTAVSFTIVIDQTAPNAPVVSGVTPTNNRRPVWSWTSGGGGGNGYYRYQLDNPIFSRLFRWTTATQYQPTSDLAVGSHTLYVQEEDAAGNISSSGSKIIVVDTSAGNPPVVTGTTPTNDNTPTWSWTSGGGIGNYKYRLDDSNIDGNPTQTTAISFTPSSVLADGLHILYIKEQDAAGNWSTSAYFGITIDTQKPAAPLFTSGTTVNPSYTRTVTWAWQSNGGGGAGRYRFNIDNTAWSNEQTSLTYTGSNLSDGNHTLYVQERDAAGNWSLSNSKMIYVFPAPTNLKRIIKVGRLGLEWTNNSTNVAGYQVCMSTCDDFTKCAPVIIPTDPAVLGPAASAADIQDGAYNPGVYVGVRAYKDINADGILEYTPFTVVKTYP